VINWCDPRKEETRFKNGKMNSPQTINHKEKSFSDVFSSTLVFQSAFLKILPFFKIMA